LFDQHLHSWHSFDSQTDPKANVEQAMARGLAGLTFTEHFDTHPDDRPKCRYDDTAYSAAIQELRRTYGGRLFIGKGIEVCFQPERMDGVLEFLRSHEFDLVVLSVHYFGGKAVHRERNWSGLDAATGTRQYLEDVAGAADWCRRLHRKQGRVFDVLGHLDLAKRYTQRFFGCHDVAPYGTLIDEILRACLDAGLTPEINTSTLRQGLDETMPGPATVRRYAALGGTAMTLGSDAHRAEDIAAGFDLARDLLADAGLRLAVFQGRERREESLDRE
jgi:histidinol-phosphatase (PHP family)